MPRKTPDEDLESILDALLDLDDAAQAAALEALAQQRPEMAARAARLLSFTRSGDTMPASAQSAAPTFLAHALEEDVARRIGQRLGAYEVTAYLKRGGMGAIYRAERADGAFNQAVAVKFLPAQWASPARRTLFERERQYLADLEHPNIARIIDAGIAPDGSPYFIMELIDGEPFEISLRKAGQAEALRLFDELLDAVSFCHRSLIVHGDLKPSNILVCDGRVRLLDFGVGRLVGSGETAKLEQGAYGYSAQFAAPELRAGREANVRTDIYSLGAIMFSCIPGVSENRELRAIAEKATADSPEARYATVDEIRADLSDYRADRPVSAYPQTRSYVLGKFLRRNRMAAAMLAAVFLTLAAGLAATFWQYRIAKHQSARAEAVAEFLTSMFDPIAPEATGAEPTTLRDILEEADKRLATDLAGAPETQNEVRAIIASGYLGLGEFDRAREMREAVLAYWKNRYEPPDENIARAQIALAWALNAFGRVDEALALCRDAANQVETLGLDRSELSAEALHCVSACLLQRRSGDAVQDAVALRRRIFEIYEELYPPDHPKTAHAISGLGEALHLAGDYAAAAEHREASLAIADRSGLSSVPSFISTLCNLALDYAAMGRYADTLKANKLCIERNIDRLGAEHHEIAAPYNNLARIYLLLGDVENGLSAAEAGLAIAEKSLPETNLVRLALEINQAAGLWQSGSAADAHAVISDAVQRMENSFGPAHPATFRARTLEARVLLELGKTRDAERVMAISPVPLTPSWSADALLWGAEIALAGGDRDEASRLAARAVEQRRRLKVFRPWQIAEAEFIYALSRGDDAMAAAQARILAELPYPHIRRKRAEEYLGLSQ